jgi:5-methylthioribose kinase
MAPESNLQSSTLLSAQTVGGYLISRGVFDTAAEIEARELGGGVSNVVLAARQREARVVVKQALERLRVPDEWLAGKERAVTEGEALRVVGQISAGSVPEVRDIDHEACVLTISEAPAGWKNWKEQLLSGSADPRVAARLGELLGTWHSVTFEDRDLARAFASSQAFDELRIDPYYRTVARRRPELSAAIDRLVQRMQATRLCLVHGDYSPKNVLVGDGLWVIDFEVAHYGDPAFDLAFMLSHLLLKSLHVPQASSDLELWGAYERSARSPLPDARYVLGHVGCLMVARVDGKSPVEYLPESEREVARRIGSEILLEPGNIGEALALVRDPAGGTR